MKHWGTRMQSAQIVAVSEPRVVNDGGFVLSVDEFIAYVARVSNPSNQNNHLTATKLLKYLAKHKHWSPFEMVHICMEINTTRDIARQILRHRSFSFQEFSQRYADPTKDMGFVTREARLQDTKNRQNSIETFNEETQFEWQKLQCIVRDTSRQAYQQAIDMGIAKEQARAVLPEGLILSRMYMAGSLRSWIHYCQVRTDISTQKEHREIALDAWYQITEQFPSLKDALDI
jgi:thymidylate synthase (FAD)